MMLVLMLRDGVDVDDGAQALRTHETQERRGTRPLRRR